MTRKLDIHVVEEYSEGFTLRTYLRKTYGEEGFYSGEEVDMTYEEHSEPTETEEGKVEELRQSKP
jgi:hypothetical protein